LHCEGEAAAGSIVETLMLKRRNPAQGIEYTPMARSVPDGVFRQINPKQDRDDSLIENDLVDYIVDLSSEDSRVQNKLELKINDRQEPNTNELIDSLNIKQDVAESSSTTSSLELALLPKVKLEQYLRVKKNEIEQHGVYPTTAELILAYEAYDLRIPPEELEQFVEQFDKFVAELFDVKKEKGEVTMIQQLLKRVYSDAGYDWNNNAMVSYFDESQAGNCSARQKFIAATLEAIGYNPDTEIAVQDFNLHTRNILKINNEWYAVDNNTLSKLQPEDKLGTPIYPLTDMKRMLLGLDPENEQFEPLIDTSTLPDIFIRLRAWIEKIIDTPEKVSRQPLKLKNSPQRGSGSLSFAVVSAFVSPNMQRNFKRASRTLAAAMLFYGVYSITQHEDIKTADDFIVQLQKDGQQIQELAEQLVENAMHKTTSNQAENSPAISAMEVATITEDELNKKIVQEQDELKDAITVDDLETLQNISISIEQVDNNPSNPAHAHVLTSEITLHVNKSGAIRFTDEALRYILTTQQFVKKIQTLGQSDINLTDHININIQSPDIQLTAEDVRRVINILLTNLEQVKLNGQVVCNVAQEQKELVDSRLDVEVRYFLGQAMTDVVVEADRTTVNLSYYPYVKKVPPEFWNYIYSVAVNDFDKKYPGGFLSASRTSNGSPSLVTMKPFDINIISTSIKFSAKDVEPAYRNNMMFVGTKNIRVKLNGAIVFDPKTEK
jgi:hypothetical protein